MNNKVLILLGIAIGTVITAGSLAGYQLVAQAERSDQEIELVVKDFLDRNPAYVWGLVKDKVQLEIDNERTEIDIEVIGVNATANLALDKAMSLENRFLIVEATGKVTTTPTSTISSADYKLTCLQVSGQTVLGCEYAQDQVIYMRGQAPDNVGQFKWSIKKGTQIVASSQSSVPSNGVFLFVWNVNGDKSLGPYTAIVEINNKIDSKQFEIK